MTVNSTVHRSSNLWSSTDMFCNIPINFCYFKSTASDNTSHAHKCKYSEDDLSLVRQHIDSFPREGSHYGRTKSSREYLSSDLNVSCLFRAFKILYPDSHVEPGLTHFRFVTALQILSVEMNQSQLPLSKICTVSMDIQQVMSTYNFCVYIGDNNESFKCIRHGGIASQGGNEISSCFVNVMSSEIMTTTNIWQYGVTTAVAKSRTT
ncbi:hypothetical protein PR048_010255 [Dryococelus australis]|uniref:Uncharacterized protein n=1 Tax=Dryococelus australis TaxID=614101 RepID=A0ABQ9I291_9NEOP|nr:hypothetical protein PR048_010255 [Dryococelus australis]